MPVLSSDAMVYRRAEAVTKHDTNNFPGGACNAIYVGGAGVMAVVMADNGEVINFTCVAGQILPVRAKRVNATNTAATLMVALY